ncbi:hypothetical protein FDP41_006212 [Naegleria fowleri]|uniref:YbaK/aminoacyl-tRNA synthetase-associated domain-containing protein n=1 Tax=Naegleria fowleri TaxID=5763 RepID=A0A6A5BKP7_NAEFO|nr:uncharacterized protein FDP41_006212 [Naegleria fowleri]KAF0974738.1 hypothetical protein FDP41_006212 [Naegleria fowleri]CAG4716775.1 unnamed protein product [Naegleria fowleri]
MQDNQRLEQLILRFQNIEKSLDDVKREIKSVGRTESSDSESSTKDVVAPSSHEIVDEEQQQKQEQTPASCAIVHESNFEKEEPNDTELIKVLKSQVKKLGFKFAKFSQVPTDYYSRSLEERRDILQTDSIHQLCKSLILENSKCVKTDCSDRNNSKYYCVIVQYSAKFNSKKLTKFVRELNQGKLGKKQFVFSLTDANKAFELTGYDYNGVSPVPLPSKEHVNIPIVLDKKIVDDHKQFWIGGGTEDWKILFNTDEFIRIFNPFVTSITYDGTGDDEE